METESFANDTLHFIGYRLSQDLIKPQEANTVSNPHTPPKTGNNSETDGNSLGTSSSSVFPKFSSPFSRSNTTMKKFANQDYYNLKRGAKSTGSLFEDPEFIPSNRLLVDDNNQYIISYFGRTRFDGSAIEWLRPHVSNVERVINSANYNKLNNGFFHFYFFFSQEICQRRGQNERPQMFVGQSDRFDINQGEIGNCWFLAAVANLVENEKCFHRVVPQDQSFDHGYSGIFRFRFWR